MSNYPTLYVVVWSDSACLIGLETGLTIAPAFDHSIHRTMKGATLELRRMRRIEREYRAKNGAKKTMKYWIERAALLE